MHKVPNRGLPAFEGSVDGNRSTCCFSCGRVLPTRYLIICLQTDFGLCCSAARKLGTVTASTPQ